MFSFNKVMHEYIKTYKIVLAYYLKNKKTEEKNHIRLVVNII